MRLRLLQSNWNRFARRDALWAICTEPERSRRRWNVAEFFETGRRDVDHIFEMTKALGLDVPTGRALDFGCGVGRLTQSLATRFDEVVGVDLAPAMVVQADSHNRHTQRCSYVINDRVDLRTWPTDSFDFVLSELTLMHMETRYSTAYLTEFVRVCRPGGLIVFQLPNRTRRQAIRDRIPRPLWDAVTTLRTLWAPRMEIYGLEFSEVREAIGAGGGVLIADEQLQSESAHIDRRYYARPGIL